MLGPVIPRGLLSKQPTVMDDIYLKLYHALPPQARNLAASMRGLYLRSWRYGPESEQLIEAAIAREQWSAARWTAYTQDRLSRVLSRAATEIPYYRNYWNGRRSRGDKGSWQDLQNWPILNKEAVRENPAAFVAEGCKLRGMFCEHTSGTTGTPLRVWSSKKTIRQWYALMEARWRRWYGVSKENRWAMIGGQVITPVTQRQPPFWVWNSGLNQLYMSSYHLTPRVIPYYFDALEKYSIEYIWGYSSSLYTLACEVLQQQRTLKMKVAIANAEPLFDHQRSVIAEAFGCPVRETYGMCEMVAAASECQSNNLHLWPEVGCIESLPAGQSNGNGMGELVCTSLLNEDMPLIRYRVGDMAIVGNGNADCSCGRSLPLISSLEGRSDDLLYTEDGRVLGRLDPVFKGNIPIKNAQIIQETLHRVRVRYTPAVNFRHDAAESIAQRLKARMGGIEVVLEELPDIPRDANGKFRAVICNLSPEVKKRWAEAVPRYS